MIPVFAPKFGLAGVIAGLFAAGEQGAWYDPSDMSTLFQDSAGTVPVTAVEQPVGRMLDKSGRGNHATQATTTKRPVLSARVNLLTKTEQFDDAVWTKKTISTSASASKIYATATGNPSFIQVGQQVSKTTNGNYTYTVEVASGEASYASVNIQDTTSPGINGFYVWVNCITQAIYNGPTTFGAGFSNISATATPLSNGYTRVIVSCTASSALTISATVAFGKNSTLTSTSWTAGDGGYVRNASLVPADQASLPYQRVNTSTDYDTSAVFPKYLNYDTVDDVTDTTFASSLGTDCTVARARVGTTPVILTAQTIGTSYAMSTGNAGLVIVNRALTAGETASLTAYLTKKGTP